MSVVAAPSLDQSPPSLGSSHGRELSAASARHHRGEARQAAESTGLLSGPFLSRLARLTTLFMVLEVVSGAVGNDPALVLAGVLSAGFAGLLVLGRLLQESYPDVPTPGVLATGMSALGVIGAVLVPDVDLALSLLPIVGVILVLPTASRRGAAVAIVAAGASSAAILTLGAIPPAFPPFSPVLHTIFPAAILLGEGLLVATALADSTFAARAALLGVQEALARQEAIESERRMLSDAVAEAVDGLVVVDLELHVLYANAAFGSQIGLPSESLLGRDLRQVVTASPSLADPPHVFALLRGAMEAGQAWQGELPLLRSSGEEWRTAWTIAPVPATDEVARFVVVSRDVTHLREIEERLDEAARERAATAEALRMMGPRGSTEATAQAMCQTIATLARVDCATIAVFESDRELVVIGAAGSPLKVGERLPRYRVKELRSRAATGPWTELVPERTDAVGRRVARDGVKAQVISPIETDAGLVGLLVLGTRSTEDAARFLERLPAAVEFTATARALLGPALDERSHQVAARSSMAAVIADRAFSPVFQPIVELASLCPVGYEALTRFEDGRPPDQTFAAAAALGLGQELEHATLEEALAASLGLPADCWLSVNVSPRYVISTSFAALVGGESRPLTIEITEHDAIGDYAPVLAALRELGPQVRVAVDDAGAGVANFTHLVNLRPQLIKIDAGLIHRIDSDPVRQSLVAGIRHFASTSGAELIAEGIETDDELVTLKALGVGLGQGYLLGRPASIIDLVTSGTSGVRPVAA